LAKKSKQKSKNKKRPILIFLDILIVVCLVGAAYFFIEPKIRNHKQKKIETEVVAEVIAKFDSEEEPEKDEIEDIVSITVDPNANKVPGESYEDFGQGINPDEIVYDANGNVVIDFIGSLKIPVIDLITPIANDDSLIAIRYGVGHTPESDPIGEKGRALIFGHWFIDYGRVFNRLNEVKAGDEFTIDILENRTRYYYKVHKAEAIDESELYNRLYEEEPKVESEVLMITCIVRNNMWWDQTGRYLVYGELVDTKYIPPR